MASKFIIIITTTPLTVALIQIFTKGIIELFIKTWSTREGESEGQTKTIEYTG